MQPAQGHDLAFVPAVAVIGGDETAVCLPPESVVAACADHAVPAGDGFLAVPFVVAGARFAEQAASHALAVPFGFHAERVAPLGEDRGHLRACLRVWIECHNAPAAVTRPLTATISAVTPCTLTLHSPVRFPVLRLG